MAAERGRERVREFQLEGLGLVVVGGLLLIGLVGAFYLGRWYERRSNPSAETAVTESGEAGDPLAHVETGEAVEAGEDLTFFDTLGGEGKEAEPQREARPATQPAASPPKPEAPAAKPAEGGEHFVQVFAGRVRTSAESLVRELEGKGYPVRIQSVSEGGQERLFKVQVGGYPTAESAREVAQRLKDAGYPTAFVTKP
jgi:cell division protein FtsN